MNPSDMTLLMTRPAPASARFATHAERALGRFGRVVISPVLEIVPLSPFPDIPDSAALAFTSENAVRVAAAHLDPAGRAAWCVGDRTAEVARRLGYAATSARGDAGALADMLGAARPGQAEGGGILHLCGVHQTGNLVQRLQAASLQARRASIYDQRPLPLTPEARKALQASAPVVLPLFSPRSAALVGAALDGAAAPLLLAFLSPSVGAAWAESPAAQAARSATAPSPDAAGMIDALRNLVKDAAQ